MTALAGSLDANVLLRLLLNDVPAQHRAALALLDNARGQLAITDTAIIEVVFVLGRHYGFERAQIAEAIEGLMALPEVNCNRKLFERALPLFAGHPGLSFEDSCLSVYAALHDAEPLWTFDQKLARQAANAKLLIQA